MLLLAIDTATKQVGVAIGDGGAVRAEVRLAGGRRHAEQLVPAISALLDWTGVRLDQLAAIAVDVGPGLFTGPACRRHDGEGDGSGAACSRGSGSEPRSRGVSGAPLAPADRRGARRAATRGVPRVVPTGAGRSPADRRVRRELARRSRRPSSKPAAKRCCSRATGSRHTRRASPSSVDASSPGPEFAAPSTAALVSLATARVEREEFSSPWDVHPLYLRESDAELNWAGVRG